MRPAATLATGSLVASIASAQVVQWDIERREVKSNNLGRRAASTYEEVITNERARGGYFATTQVGTPGQNLTLQLDTGSSDIWVPYTGATVCTKTTSSSGSSSSKGCTLGACK